MAATVNITTYTDPVANAAALVAGQSTIFGFTSGAPLAVTGTISNPTTGAFGDYILTQLSVTTTAAQGNSASEVITSATTSPKLKRFFATLGLLALSACASSHASAYDGDAVPIRNSHVAVDQLVIHVINKNWCDVVVYLNDARIGEVRGLTGDVKIRLSSNRVEAGGTLLLRVHQIGGGDFSAQPVTYRAGQEVLFVINPMIQSSDVYNL